MIGRDNFLILASPPDDKMSIVVTNVSIGGFRWVSSAIPIGKSKDRNLRI